MKYKGYNAKRDDNEKEIVEALEKAGATVFRLDQPTDLLVGYHGSNILIEVKDGKKTASRKKKTELQRDFFRDWRGQCFLVETVEQALEVLAQYRSKTY